MASRMDRYQKDELIDPMRSSKNKELYSNKDLLDISKNFDSVATIERTNEVDLSRVNNMIQNRENYKKKRHLNDIMGTKEEVVEEKLEVMEESKNYDIKDILSRVKENDLKSRRLNKEQYETLQSINSTEKKYDIEKEEMELQELINTISSSRMLNDVKEALTISDDDGLFDDLKSDTMVGTASSIKKIIEAEKDRGISSVESDIDKSFYTSSLGFTQSDFEELKDINHDLKRSNKFIIILLVVLIMLFIVSIMFFIIK